MEKKTELIRNIINQYKSEFHNSTFENEKYKWELLTAYGQRPNVDAPDFQKEILEIDFKNLVYHLSYAVLKDLAAKKPEELRALFRMLFDEEKDLHSRIKAFKKDSKELYRTIGGEKSAHQDERSIATYLTFRYPEKYAFYQAKIYKQLCDLMKEDVEKVDKKYIHYLSMLEKIAYFLKKEESEFIEQVNIELSDTKISNLKLHAQNIVFTVLNSQVENGQEQSSFDKSEYSTYIQELKRIVNKLGLKRGDERIVFTTRDKSYNFIVGQRYAFCLYRNNSEGNFGVISKQPIGENSKKYEGENPKAYFSLLDKSELNSDHRNEIEKAIIKELERTEKSGYLKYRDVDFENMIFGESSNEKQNTMKAPLNQILFGPPGTGKTFHLKDEYFEKYTTKESALTKREHFEEIVRDLTWWQVIAIALLEKNDQSVSDLLANEWVAFKANISESKNVRATIWGNLQIHTVQESKSVSYTQRTAPLLFDKNKNKSWRIIEEEVKEQIPELYDILDEVNNFNPSSDKEIKRYVFTTFHQSFSYEDFIEGIKPTLSDMDTSTHVGYHIEDGVFKELCKRAESDPDNRYAIFIDEINRGNVSAIFGELITLIESDKRLGEVNEMKVKLPYSKKHFGVPSNLDIYGTMNTADRSVEALDTALRRRFSFKEIMPNPSLLAGVEIDGIKLDELLTTVNDRIEVLIDRDHTIGHSYFMNVKSKNELKQVFKDKILPLLQEYFFGYYSKMELVIGSYFFETNLSEVTFAVENDNYFDRGKRYVLKDLDDDRFDIIRALQELMGNKVEEQ